MEFRIYIISCAKGAPSKLGMFGILGGSSRHRSEAGLTEKEVRECMKFCNKVTCRLPEIDLVFTSPDLCDIETASNALGNYPILISPFLRGTSTDDAIQSNVCNVPYKDIRMYPDRDVHTGNLSTALTWIRTYINSMHLVPLEVSSARPINIAVIAHPNIIQRYTKGTRPEPLSAFVVKATEYKMGSIVSIHLSHLRRSFTST